MTTSHDVTYDSTEANGYLANGLFSLLFPQNMQEVDKVIHRHDKSRDRLPFSY